MKWPACSALKDLSDSILGIKMQDLMSEQLNVDDWKALATYAEKTVLPHLFRTFRGKELFYSEYGAMFERDSRKFYTSSDPSGCMYGKVVNYNNGFYLCAQYLGMGEISESSDVLDDFAIDTLPVLAAVCRAISNTV